MDVLILSDWLSSNYIELFGAVTGILYVIFEIRQNIWLWPVGIVTSAVYIWVFFTSRFYADMSLQGYYLIISCIGWYWWTKRKTEGMREEETKRLRDEATGREGEKEDKVLLVTRIDLRTGLILAVVFVFLYLLMYYVLSRFTNSPVPVWDSFITSLSIVATWMLARKIYEHWYLWIIVNFVSAALFLIKGLYPTLILYLVYGAMSFVGLIEWKKTIKDDLSII
jgi:nicotinamide mononucleotide transporter